MKRCFAIFIIALMISVCGCSKTSINTSDDVTLTFIYGDKDICVALEDDEAEKVIDILNGNNYDSGIPKCGFDKNISLKVGEGTFAIACDTCNCIQDLGNLKYFNIPEDEMKYIRSLFEKYGGYFPCV